MREDDVGKNKSTTPSLAFPFALILNKIDSIWEKENMHFGGFGIKHISFQKKSYMCFGGSGIKKKC